ncbi:hypothetical protein D3C71_2026400 [compost metagenome]
MFVVQAFGSGDDFCRCGVMDLDTFLAAIQVEKGKDFQLGNQFGGKRHKDSDFQTRRAAPSPVPGCAV